MGQVRERAVFGLCWELDALSPTVIAGLIRAEVEELRDEAKWSAAKAEEDANKAHLEALVENWAEVTDFLDTME